MCIILISILVWCKQHLIANLFYLDDVAEREREGHDHEED